MEPLNLFYITAGMGHKAAALGIRECLEEEKIPSTLIDFLVFSGKLFKWSCSLGYDFIGEHSHMACRAMYRLTDRKRNSSPFVQVLDALSMENFEGIDRYIKDNNPKSCICTHFLPATVLAKLKRGGRYGGNIYVVITDYGLHKMWVNDFVDKYFVASQSVRNALLNAGVSQEQISVSGIPVQKKFQAKQNKFQILKDMGLDGTRFTLLVVASCFSDRQVVRTLEKIFHSGMALNLLVVRGRSHGLMKRLNQFKSTERIDFHAYGFVSNIEKLMAVSDIMVTKPGGLTISEAMAAGLPLIMFNPIPYQETYNADYIAKKGAGVLANSVDDILLLIRNYYNEPSSLEFMRRKAQEVAMPKAAETIAKSVTQAAKT